MAFIVRMLLRRILVLVPLVLGVAAFVFIVMRFSNSKPEYAYFQGANPTPEQIHQFQVENGLLDPLPLISHELPLAEFSQAIELVGSGDPKVGKVLLRP